MQVPGHWIQSSSKILGLGSKILVKPANLPQMPHQASCHANPAIPALLPFPFSESVMKYYLYVAPAANRLTESGELKISRALQPRASYSPGSPDSRLQPTASSPQLQPTISSPVSVPWTPVQEYRVARWEQAPVIRLQMIGGYS